MAGDRNILLWGALVAVAILIILGVAVSVQLGILPVGTTTAIGSNTSSSSSSSSTGSTTLATTTSGTTTGSTTGSSTSSSTTAPTSSSTTSTIPPPTTNYTTNGIFATGIGANVVLPSGFGFYSCAAGVTGYTIRNFSWVTLLFSGWAGLGRQTSDTCSLNTNGAANVSFVGIGVANRTAPVAFASNSKSLTYNVVSSGSFVVLEGADGGIDNLPAFLVPSGCSVKITAQNNGAQPFAFIAVCPSQAAGSYTANFTSSTILSYELLAAYVFPPGNT